MAKMAWHRFQGIAGRSNIELMYALIRYAQVTKKYRCGSGFHTIPYTCSFRISGYLDCSEAKEKEGTMHKVALLPGDGIGPEITAAAIRVIESAGVQSDRKRNLDLVLQ
jgi:hypothetical protein